MERKQENLWQSRPEVKKGNIGEKYAREFLERKGFIVYKPVSEGAHKIDFFAHNGADKKVVAIEAKSKKRMAKCTKTGFNTTNLIHYKEIERRHSIPTFIYFVDEFEECVYGQWLSKLSDGCEKGIVTVWELSEMEFIRWLTPKEVLELKECSKPDNYDYSNVQQFFKSTIPENCPKFATY